MFDPETEFQTYYTKTQNFFKLSEFRNVIPAHDLLWVLNLLRIELGRAIHVQDGAGSARTIQEHINLYKEKYGEDYWQANIPWDSKHLAIHGSPYLRAVDIYALSDEPMEYLTGVELKDIVIKTCPVYIFLGLGVFEHGLHIDVGRKNSHRIWYY